MIECWKGNDSFFCCSSLQEDNGVKEIAENEENLWKKAERFGVVQGKNIFDDFLHRGVRPGETSSPSLRGNFHPPR